MFQVSLNDTTILSSNCTNDDIIEESFQILYRLRVIEIRKLRVPSDFMAWHRNNWPGMIPDLYSNKSAGELFRCHFTGLKSKISHSGAISLIIGDHRQKLLNSKSPIYEKCFPMKLRQRGIETAR